ncbi:MAG: EAL domain-containing protein [Halioglobus sp.]
MTVAGKINALVVIVFIVAGTLLVSHIAVREYTYERDQLINQASAQVLSQPQLQPAIYYHDRLALSKSLNEFLSPKAVRQVAIIDASGTTVARREQRGTMGSKAVNFREVRTGFSAVDEGLTTRDGDSPPPKHELFAAFTGGEKLYDLTIPIFSGVNPNKTGLERSDFVDAFSAPDSVNSQHVIGYVHLIISRTMLLAEIAPFVGITLVGYILLLLVCSLIILTVSRRITAPLARLARIADGISSGEFDQDIQVQGSGEVKEIATTLNTIMGGLSHYKTKMDVGHQLLSMKVKERTQQLSRRNKELNQAVLEVTETKDRLRQLAYFDSLTSLPNRRLFTEQLSLLLRLTKRSDQILALLFLDLDNFKRINDSLGHNAGDQLLRKVAMRMSGCVRDSDVVAHYVDSGSRIDVSRLGGDEFTVVLNQIENAEAAGLVAQRLIDALAAPMTIDGHELVVTPSIGIAIAPTDASTVEDLLRAADTAMYHAKTTGKNNYLYYSSDMDAAGVERLKLETDLRKAVELNQLVLHYQPQVDTITGTVVGAEALLRWNHPEHGLVPPFKFIPLAEEMGLIGQLGDWTLIEACRQMKEFRAQGLKLPKVAINVSALQFNSDFINRVEEVLRETKLEPSALELELTEGIAMDDADATIKALHDLKEIGVSLSIDDFGTGYSSLSYLARFPLDELKIDRSFVVEFANSSNDASLVIAIIAMGKSMNLKMVAEGVETLDQYHFLTRHGATVIQGYLFSKPVPAEELRLLLAPYHFLQQIEAITDVNEPAPEVALL